MIIAVKTRRYRLLSIGFAFLLAGCALFGPSPKEVAGNFLAAVQKVDPTEAQRWSESKDTTPSTLFNQTDPASEEMARAILSKVSFELGQEMINNDQATVDAKITSLDMGRIMAGAMKDMIGMAFAQAFSNDPNAEQQAKTMGQRILLNAINDPNAPKTSSNVKIHLVKTAEGWKVSKDNPELLSALTGHADQLFGP